MVVRASQTTSQYGMKAYMGKRVGRENIADHQSWHRGQSRSKGRKRLVARALRTTNMAQRPIYVKRLVMRVLWTTSQYGTKADKDKRVGRAKGPNHHSSWVNVGTIDHHR